jgi:hypothetical protein
MTNISNKQKIIQDRELDTQIIQSIEDYILEKKSSDSVGIGNSFCEWGLFNIFELREDEVIDSMGISGKFDNGIDAVFEYNGDLCILQSKYKTSHSIDSIQRFIADCQRIATEPPETDRLAVLETCKRIRESFENDETINCYYITNSYIDEWEIQQYKSSLKNLNGQFKNLKFFLYDFDDIKENIEIKKGMLPKEFRGKVIPLSVEENFEVFETMVARVKIHQFASFVNSGGNMLFHSNIRNYLKSTKINQGIKATLKEKPEDFWYFNNGVTIVCDEFIPKNGKLYITAPQIVNGCQTAKTLADYFKTKTTKEQSLLLKELREGHLLVKIIKTKKSADDKEKKKLRDEITRFTNSQNAVQGLDFYALDDFQRTIADNLRKNYGFYYEIQRGSFITLSPSEQKSFKGDSSFNYLIEASQNSKKFVLPAKEVIQSFAAAIQQLPHVAYGRANELTPVGSRWGDIVNEDTRKLPLEHFLFPYLVYKYAKDTLGYKTGSDDFRKNAAFLFVSTYYLILINLVNKIKKLEYYKPEEINIALYKSIFMDSNLNKELLKNTNKLLRTFFRDFTIIEEVGDNLRGFLQNKIHKDKIQNVLKGKISQMIEDLEKDLEYKDIFPQLKNIIEEL